ncbi:MAG: Gfo/Idh/MocA family oxidoreductase [Armatimonadota bacterium]|jgi:predicted dehydrogenase
MADMGVAVVGAGFIGPVHVEALGRLGLTVTGILGCDDAESQSAKQALGLPKAYGSFDELLQHDAVQSVHLAVPNRLHYDMSRRALEAGKHVMCEKPLAMNSAESAELVHIAGRSGRAAGVNYNLRYYPLCLEARDMVQRGDVGEVYSVCGSYVQDWMFHPTDYNWRVLAEEGGELRAVADIGTHWLDLVHAITSLEVEALCADLSTVHPVRQRPRGEVETFKAKEQAEAVETEPIDIATEDYGCIMLRYAGGARGCLWVSQVTAGRKNCLRYELAGSKCAMAWRSEHPNDLWIGHRDEPNEILMRDPGLVSPDVAAFIDYPGGHNEGFPDTFKQCFRSFYDYIEAGDFSAPATFPTFEDGHREIVLCEAILRSQREGGWVEVKGDSS